MIKSGCIEDPGRHHAAVAICRCHAAMSVPCRCSCHGIPSATSPTITAPSLPCRCLPRRCHDTSQVVAPTQRFPSDSTKRAQRSPQAEHESVFPTPQTRETPAESSLVSGAATVEGSATTTETGGNLASERAHTSKSGLPQSLWRDDLNPERPKERPPKRRPRLSMVRRLAEFGPTCVEIGPDLANQLSMPAQGRPLLGEAGPCQDNVGRHWSALPQHWSKLALRCLKTCWYPEHSGPQRRGG